MDFRILGPLEVLAEGRPITLGGPKQRALLALLLLHPNEVVGTEQAIDELWGYGPPGAAAKTVQMHVSRLRKALDRGAGAAGVLVTRGRGYELSVDPDDVDAHRFERLVGEGRGLLEAGDPERAAETLDGALSLWRGEALSGLGDERFAQVEAARLEDVRATATEELVEAKLALGRQGEVIGELERLISRHPYRERARVQLMLALYRAERQADALQAYQDARRTLVEELGIEPGERLRELERAVLAQDPGLLLPAPRQPPAKHDAPPRAGRAFAGREAELAELVGGLDDALAGYGRLFLLTGEPGIGKSRLAEELLDRARDRGAEVLVGRCWEAGGAPAYWPWIQALRGHLREGRPQDLAAAGAGPELAAILPELRELVPDLEESTAPDSEGARFRLFESAARLLRDASSSRALVIFLDDLHAADVSSLLLLRFVHAELAGARLLVVGSYRDTEASEDVGQSLAELAREATVRRIALKGLPQSATSRLLELTVGEAPEEELAARIQVETQGNPLFATEIGRLLAAEGAHEQAGERLPIPEGVREAIGLRLQRRSDACREVLRLASVIGRELDVEVLELASDLAESELVAALDEATSARLVEELAGPGGTLRFSHILVRDVLYEGLGAPRRTRMHRTIGKTLERLFARNLEPHLAELAHHYLMAGSAGVEKARQYSELAGDRAASQHAYEEAARHYTSALRLTDWRGSEEDPKTCELMLSLGDALSRAGNADEAKAVFRRAADVAERADRADQLARAAQGYGGRLMWARAETDPAFAPLLERALEAVGPHDSVERVRLLARLAGARRDDRHRDRRVALATEALEMARRLEDPRTLAYALEGHWVALEGPDTPGEGVAAGEQLIALGERIGDKERVFAGHDYRLHAFWMLADRAGVDVELDVLEALADELRQPAQLWHVGTCRVMLAVLEGRFDDAERTLPKTLAIGERAQTWNAQVSHRIALFVLRRAQGRLSELEELLRRSVHEHPALLRFQCALVHLYGELGRTSECRATLDELLSRDLSREHVDAEWLFSLCLLTDPCAFLEDAAASKRLYAWLLPYARLYAEAPVEVSFGSIARHLGVLATTMGKLNDAERHLMAAIETEWRMRAPPWLAHAQHDLAHVLLLRADEGDAERGRKLAEDALRGYRQFGMETWAGRAADLIARQGTRAATT